jgi:hypothetical protein
MPLKRKITIVVFVLTLSLIVPSSFIVLSHERSKKVAKIEKDSKYFESLAESYKTYLNEHEAQIKLAKQDNLAQMQEAERVYNDLLARQSTLIAQHTTITTSTPQASTQTTTKSAPKPASKSTSSS